MQRPRFGDLAVSVGYLTPEQLEHALTIQQQEDQDGQPRRPLGLICMQQGYLTYTRLMELLERQERSATAV